jgi:hypothetical protein
MMTDDIDAMAARLDTTLRAAMEPHLAEGGRTAVFARLTLAIAPVWARAMAAEMQRAEGHAVDIAQAAANVVANLMGSTCETLLRGDPRMTEQWIGLVDACFRAAIKSPVIVEFFVPPAGHA